MNQVVSEVLEDFGERLALDERVHEALAESLIEALSQNRVPDGASLAEIIHHSVNGTDK